MANMTFGVNLLPKNDGNTYSLGNSSQKWKIYVDSINDSTIPENLTFTDTKNTAGSMNSSSKLFLIGATTQVENSITNSYQYTYTNNGLLSASQVGLNLNGTEKAHMEWNNTDQCLDFIFT